LQRETLASEFATCSAISGTRAGSLLLLLLTSRPVYIAAAGLLLAVAADAALQLTCNVRITERMSERHIRCCWLASSE